MTVNYLDKALVIGAGAAGLAMMRSLKKRGIAFDAVESYQEIGGLWNYERSDSPVSQNTHAIGHKHLQLFSGFPMPENYPAYPNKRQILDYLINFAKTHDLQRFIQFNTLVNKIEKAGDYWQVTLSNQEVRYYRCVLIATGYHNKPKIPQFPGVFTGKVWHSKEYKNPEQIKNQTVLVVGSGQSAMDILEDSAIVAKKTFHSTRRGFYVSSKFILGFPAEKVANFPIIRQIPTQIIFKILSFLSPAFLILQGIDLRKLNIPNKCDSQGIISPVFNQNIYQYYLQGDIIHRPNIKEFKGDTVIFEDGTEEVVDVIIYATGFNVDFPFISRNFLNWSAQKSCPDLYLNVFPPDFDNLFVIGMVHPIGTHWQVFDAQSQLVAAYIQAKAAGSKFAQKIDQQKQKFQQEQQKQTENNKPLLVDKRWYIEQAKRLTKQLAL